MVNLEVPAISCVINLQSVFHSLTDPPLASSACHLPNPPNGSPLLVSGHVSLRSAILTRSEEWNSRAIYKTKKEHNRPRAKVCQRMIRCLKPHNNNTNIARTTSRLTNTCIRERTMSPTCDVESADNVYNAMKRGAHNPLPLSPHA